VCVILAATPAAADSAWQADMHEHCPVCAEACRSCEQACNELRGALG
jgi:hypothetical protein